MITTSSTEPSLILTKPPAPYPFSQLSKNDSKGGSVYPEPLPVIATPIT